MAVRTDLIDQKIAHVEEQMVAIHRGEKVFAVGNTRVGKNIGFHQMRLQILRKARASDEVAIRARLVQLEGTLGPRWTAVQFADPTGVPDALLMPLMESELLHIALGDHPVHKRQDGRRTIVDNNGTREMTPDEIAASMEKH